MTLPVSPSVGIPVAPPSSEHISTMTSGMARADEGAFRQFHSLYFTRLCRYVLVVASGNEQLMRDAVQETYRRLAKHVRTFSDERVFWCWLTVLAKTALADERRKRRRYEALLERFAGHGATTAELRAEHADDMLSELVETGVRSLELDEQALIQWKYYERCSVREIALRLESTEGAIESKLVRIRRKLKAAVEAALTHEYSA